MIKWNSKIYHGFLRYQHYKMLKKPGLSMANIFNKSTEFYAKMSSGQKQKGAYFGKVSICPLIAVFLARSEFVFHSMIYKIAVESKIVEEDCLNNFSKG